MAVCEQWVLEGDARVKVLADEKVAVVQSCGIEADEDFLWAGRGLGHVFELEAVGELSIGQDLVIDIHFGAYG
jgi:hypothetical protein